MSPCLTVWTNLRVPNNLSSVAWAVSECTLMLARGTTVEEISSYTGISTFMETRRTHHQQAEDKSIGIPFLDPLVYSS